MIRPGEVRYLREVRGKVQAQVCLGASVARGSAIVQVETASPRVLALLAKLKAAVAEETRGMVSDILEDQREWDQERTG